MPRAFFWILGAMRLLLVHDAVPNGIQHCLILGDGVDHRMGRRPHVHRHRLKAGNLSQSHRPVPLQPG